MTSFKIWFIICNDKESSANSREKIFHLKGRREKWRKRVGIEPTSPDSLPKDIGFEVQGAHQNPSASVLLSFILNYIPSISVVN
jgi:hypothetical protein